MPHIVKMSRFPRENLFPSFPLSSLIPQQFFRTMRMQTNLRLAELMSRVGDERRAKEQDGNEYIYIPLRRK